MLQLGLNQLPVLWTTLYARDTPLDYIILEYTLAGIRFEGEMNCLHRCVPTTYTHFNT